jgi:hypothetical protein
VPKKQTSKLYCGFLKNDTNIFAALSPWIEIKIMN